MCEYLVLIHPVESSDRRLVCRVGGGRHRLRRWERWFGLEGKRRGMEVEMERVVRDRRVSVEVRERFMLRGVRDKKRWDVDGGTGHRSPIENYRNRPPGLGAYRD